MSFKHDNGRNTDLYKSLEKIARQKGLIEEKKLTKSASTKSKFSPGKFLDENIANLCIGLREQGLASQASDLEGKFLMYKMAKSSAPADVDPEIMQLAHPTGSTRVSNVAAEAVVEDLLDVHLAALQVALKQPTGQIKYASSKDVLRAVKIALAISYDERKKKFAALRTRAIGLVKAIESKVKADVNAESESLGITYNRANSKRYYEAYNMLLTILNNETTTENIKWLNEWLVVLENTLKPSEFWGGITSDVWNEVSSVEIPLLKETFKLLTDERNDELSEKINRDKDFYNKPTVDPEKSPPTKKEFVDNQNVINFNEESARAIETLKSWTNSLENVKYDKYRESASAWIKSKSDNITNLVNRFSPLSAEKKIEFAPDYLTKLRGYTWKQPNDFETFRKNLGLK